MKVFWQILGVALGCTIKPVISIPAARAAQVGPIETFIGASIGGCVGVIVFLFLTDFIVLKIKERRRRRLKEGEIHPVRTKKIFTRRNRFIVNLINKYGLIGIAAITPLLSIPLAAFIAERINDKFVKNRKKVVAYLCTSIVIWSFVMVSITRLF